jgi:hypothetical protein
MTREVYYMQCYVPSVTDYREIRDLFQLLKRMISVYLTHIRIFSVIVMELNKPSVHPVINFILVVHVAYVIIKYWLACLLQLFAQKLTGMPCRNVPHITV